MIIQNFDYPRKCKRMYFPTNPDNCDSSALGKVHREMVSVKLINIREKRSLIFYCEIKLEEYFFFLWRNERNWPSWFEAGICKLEKFEGRI